MNSNMHTLRHNITEVDGLELEELVAWAYKTNKKDLIPEKSASDIAAGWKRTLE